MGTEVQKCTCIPEHMTKLLYGDSLSLSQSFVCVSPLPWLQVAPPPLHPPFL